MRDLDVSTGGALPARYPLIPDWGRRAAPVCVVC